MNNYTKIYLILFSLTTFAFLTAYLEITSLSIIAILLFTTFIKGHLIIEYFMQLKEVSGSYRYIPTIWLGSVILLIALGYYL